MLTILSSATDSILVQHNDDKTSEFLVIYEENRRIPFTKSYS